VVIRRTLIVGLCVSSALFAEITVTSTSVDMSSAQIQQAIGKLDAALDQVFYALASVAGPPIVNAAAFSSTIGIQRQSANLPTFQLEPSAALLVPSKGAGDERLNSFFLYAVNVVGGFTLNDDMAIQVRGFYLPELAFQKSDQRFTFQPFNLGLTLTRRVKKEGEAWYDPAIITPLDLAYMNGRFSASFKKRIENLEFDPDGDGAQGNSARANFEFQDDFLMRWDVYSFTTGIILAKPFLRVFTARLGVLTSLHAGNARLTNTATGNFLVSASAVSGSNVFEVNDTASVTFRNTASFKPVLVSGQFTIGLGLSLGPVSLNLDLAQNIQVNSTAIILQLGCWF
jgi:hypothetical protein